MVLWRFGGGLPSEEPKRFLVVGPLTPLVIFTRIGYFRGPMARTKHDQSLSQRSLPGTLRKGEIRKREILEATVDCLAKDGLFRTTFEAIGQRAGIGKSHVVYHFPKLDELILMAMKYVYATGQEIVTEYIAREKDPKRYLSAYVHGTFDWIRSHPLHSPIAALLVYQSMCDARFRTLQTEVREVGRARILAMLKQLRPQKQKGLLSLAESVQALIMGSLIYFKTTQHERDLDQLEKETLQSIERLIRE